MGQFPVLTITTVISILKILAFSPSYPLDLHRHVGPVLILSGRLLSRIVHTFA
jgi:hypothetical protein